MKDFSLRVKKAVEPFLQTRGFSFGNGMYRRSSGAAVEARILFDNGGSDTSSFRVVIGFAAPGSLSEQEGLYAPRYFTGGSLSETPRKLRCGNIKTLEGSLRRFKSAFDLVLEPYLAELSNCHSLAETLQGKGPVG